jgi:hypothetical protein
MTTTTTCPPNRGNSTSLLTVQTTLPPAGTVTVLALTVAPVHNHAPPT